MKKTIIVYELLRLIKDGKAPEKIKYQNRTFSRVWSDYMGDEPIDAYYVDDDGDNWNVDGFLTLDTEIEILEEVEDKEYEDIEEISGDYIVPNTPATENEAYIMACFLAHEQTINALIRNQKKILERIKKNELQGNS